MKEQMKQQQNINGINVDELFATVDAIKEQPEIAKFKFRAANKWVNSGNNQTTVNEFFGAGQEFVRDQSFVLEKDEPPILLGTDKGANPVEYALAALAGCLTTTLVCHAAAQGVAIDVNRIETRRRHRFARLSRFGLNRQKRFKPNSRQFQYQSGRAQGKATGTR